MKNKETSLSEIGLYGLIEHINKKIAESKNYNSDVLSEDSILFDEELKEVTSQTLMLEGIHFDLIYTPLQHLGFKLVVNAITDIIAMNSIPTKINIAVGLSKRMNLEKTDLLLSGIQAACDHYNVELLGFKPFPSLTGLTLSASSFGKAINNKIVNRNSAKSTDVVLITGDLGASLLGLHLLEREKRVLNDVDTATPELGDNDYILRRQLKPEARLNLVNRLNELKITPTSMIAVKEGLANAILVLSKQSKVGCRIYENKIPLAQETLKAAKEMEFNPLIAALNGGEDYEILFTVSLTEFQENEILFTNIASAIGYITEESKSNRIVSLANEEIEITAQGWGK